MNFTKHAKKRSRQRGFNSFVLDIISTYGRVENAPGGAVKIFLGKKEAQNIFQEIKTFMQMVSKATGGTLVLNVKSAPPRTPNPVKVEHSIRFYPNT